MSDIATFKEHLLTSNIPEFSSAFISSLKLDSLDETLREKISLLQMYGSSYKKNYQNQKELNAKLKKYIQDKEEEYKSLEGELKAVKERSKALIKENRALEDRVLEVLKEKEEYRVRCVRLQEKLEKLVKYMKKLQNSRLNSQRGSNITHLSKMPWFTSPAASNQHFRFDSLQSNSSGTLERELRSSVLEYTEPDNHHSAVKMDTLKDEDYVPRFPTITTENKEILIEDKFGEEYVEGSSPEIGLPGAMTDRITNTDRRDDNESPSFRQQTIFTEEDEELPPVTETEMNDDANENKFYKNSAPSLELSGTFSIRSHQQYGP